MSASYQLRAVQVISVEPSLMLKSLFTLESLGTYDVRADLAAEDGICRNHRSNGDRGTLSDDGLGRFGMKVELRRTLCSIGGW
jgi:hypothetical protein